MRQRWLLLSLGLVLLKPPSLGADETPLPPTAPQPASPLPTSPPPRPLPPRPLPPLTAPPPRPLPSRYELRLGLDISLLLAGAALWGGSSFLRTGSEPGSWCGTSTTQPCNSSGINGLDRVALGLYSPGAATAANVIAGVVPGALIVFDIVDSGLKNWRGWLGDAVVVAEATLWSGAIQDVVRRAARRPRPFMYTPGLNPGEREGGEADLSFFSGHTSNLFAMVTATAYSYTLRHPRSKWNYLVWSLSMGAASVEPVMRVWSGAHFPTDCIVGAVVGTASGLLFPEIHRRHWPVQLTASSSSDHTTVAVVGRF
jgi:membrane-associated phospholipid phosphatase